MKFVQFFSLILSISLIVSVITLCFNCFAGSCILSEYFSRWVISILISSVVTMWGLKRKSLNWTGAASGFLIGVVLTFSSYCFLACLLTFFYTSSKATHYHAIKKKKFEAEYKEGGQRNWIQVICNGGMALELALLYLFEEGVGESPLNFTSHSARRSWLAAGVLSALAGVNGDTWASELGTVLSKTEPRLITTLKRVPIGTNGGLTLSGLFFSALGGFVVGFSYFIALLLTNAKFATLQQAFFLSLIGTYAGIFGSLVDSLIGATLQYSGMDVQSGKVVEQPGPGVIHISGRSIFSNHSVNLIMSIINAIVVPTIAVHFYPFFR